MKEFAEEYEKPRERVHNPLEHQELYELNQTVEQTIQYVDNVIDYKKKALEQRSPKTKKARMMRSVPS